MTQQDQMPQQDRTNLRMRRAGLAATVVLGCSLITVSEVPGLAASGGTHPTQTATSQASPLVPNFLDLPIGQRASHGIANPLAPLNANGEPAASATQVNGKTQPGTTTGTLPGLTPMAPGTASGDQTAGTASGFPTVTGPLSSASVPSVMAQAYQNAATHAPAGCNIPATLLAAIGQVESGNLAGEKITTDHRAYPGVWGPELNGNGYEAIPDTDHGVLDGDTTWDRAVGPMQFIPSTWRMFAVDGDNDGKTDPQDVFDSASTAAKYLCYGGRDLSTTAGIDAAVLSYNHSDAYLALVLKWKQSFDTGTTFSQLPTVAPLPNKAPATKVTVVRRYPITVPKLPVQQPTTTSVPGGNDAGTRPVTTVKPTAKPTTPASTSKPTTSSKPTATATAQPTSPVTTAKPTSPVTTSKPTSPVTTTTASTTPTSTPTATSTPTSSAPTTSTRPTTTPSTSTTPTSTPTSVLVPDTTTSIVAKATGLELTLSAPTTGSNYKWSVQTDKHKAVNVTTSNKSTLDQTLAAGTYVVGLTYTDADGATVTDSVTVTLGNGTVSFVKGASEHKVTPAPDNVKHAAKSSSPSASAAMSTTSATASAPVATPSASTSRSAR